MRGYTIWIDCLITDEFHGITITVVRPINDARRRITRTISPNFSHILLAREFHLELLTHYLPAVTYSVATIGISNYIFGSNSYLLKQSSNFSGDYYLTPCIRSFATWERRKIKNRVHLIILKFLIITYRQVESCKYCFRI